jgi:hypothetical protein
MKQTMIKRACLAVLVCGLIPAAAFASPCAPGSLTSFIALSSTGCTIGASQFFNFTNLPLLGGATPIPDSSTFLSPLGVSTPGFRFNVNSDAGFGDILERVIGFSVSSPGLVGGQAFMTGNNVTGDGAITVVDKLCLGAAFGVGQFCSAIDGQLVDFDLGILGNQTSESSSFASMTALGVIVDIVVDGGTDGHAGLASATTQFTPAAVPESSMLPFVAIGLIAGLAGIRGKRSNSRQF